MKRIILITLILLVIGLTGWYQLSDSETKTLTDADREGIQGSFIRLTDGVTHYEIAGPDTAEAVVLVHGFSTPYYIWESTFVALIRAGFRVVRFDSFGRGYSDRPDVDYNEELYDRQLTELTERLNLRTPFHIAGLSFGGAVTAYFVSHHPGKVKSAIFIDPVAKAMPAQTLPFFIGDFVFTVTRIPHMAESQTEDFSHPENFPDWIQRYANQMRFHGFKHALESTVYSYKSNPEELYKKVSELHKPSLLIWGRNDKTIKFQESARVISSLHPQFLPVDNAGHLPHLENPILVNGRIVDFLKQNR